MSASASTASATGPDRSFRSLEYGLGLLRLFTAERPVWGIAELARELNVDSATAHRYAATCLELGYLEQALTRRYRLTRRCAEPGTAMLETLAPMRAARPLLRELRRQSGRTVSLAILDGAEVFYVLRLCGFARGQYELEEGLGAGLRLPAGGTAAGRALLAAIDEIEARPPEQSPPIQVGMGGLTVDEGAARAGARGLAVAVPGGTEATSAIELTVPAEFLSAAELLAEFGEPLVAAGAALQGALGG
jgi:IclR family pca regulon transcriptional regulator